MSIGETVPLSAHAPTMRQETEDMADSKVKDQEQVTRSPIEQRIADAFSSLEEQVVKAEESKDQAKPVSDFAKVLGSVMGKVQSADEDTNLAIAGALGEDGIGLYVAGVESLRALYSALSGKGEESDREQGDASANALRALIVNHLMDEESEVKAQALVTRWDATKPKGRKSGSTSTSTSDPKRTAPLGFSARITCQEVGCNWSASCSKDDLNSLRRQGQVHAKDKHQNLNIVKGHNDHKMLTDAIDKVMHGEAVSQDGGKFIVTKVEG